MPEALALWRGPPLGEFAGADWADREAARLDALHLQALQGRYDALMELDRAREVLIDDERLVALTGPGGSGKTRFAIEVAGNAARRGDVVWLAELAPLQDGGLAVQAVAAAVGVETGTNPLDELLGQSEALNGLLVLDNCEHLLDACAALAERLLAAAPELRLLATSREPLGLAGERVWPIGSLELPESSGTSSK
jgi:predicted ATPase